MTREDCCGVLYLITNPLTRRFARMSTLLSVSRTSTCQWTAFLRKLEGGVTQEALADKELNGEGYQERRLLPWPSDDGVLPPSCGPWISFAVFE